MLLLLHDLVQAARYADHLIVLEDDALAAAGHPGNVLTEELLGWVFGLTARVLLDPVFGTPMVIPIARVPRYVGRDVHRRLPHVLVLIAWVEHVQSARTHAGVREGGASRSAGGWTNPWPLVAAQGLRLRDLAQAQCFRDTWRAQASATHRVASPTATHGWP